jgi:hypothetical protein
VGLKVATTSGAMSGLADYRIIPPVAVPAPRGLLLLLAWGTLFAMLTPAGLARARRQGGSPGRLPGRMAILLALVTLFAACGASSVQNNPNATPAGTYTLTVTATSGSLMQTAQVTMKVQ